MIELLNLNAFTEDSSENNERVIITLHHSKIIAKEQARKIFKNIKELSENILDVGLLQPIIIENEADENGKYPIIDGERRWRACKLADVSVDCVKNKDRDNFKKIQIIANLQREDLNLIESCNSIKELKELNDEYKHNDGMLAKAIGKDKSWVSRRLKIASADQKFKTILSDNNIEAITTADDLEKVFKLNPNTALKLAEKGATRIEIQKKVKALKKGKSTRVRKRKDKVLIPILNYLGSTVYLTSKNSGIDDSGKSISIDLSKIRVSGVK
jgi:ParB family chromosome partitioning protein